MAPVVELARTGPVGHPKGFRGRDHVHTMMVGLARIRSRKAGHLVFGGPRVS